jgi:hypothetical protein
MTFNTSDVAVCCSSDSLKSSVRWRSIEQARVLDGDDRLTGEIVTSSICLSVNGRTFFR